MSLGEINIIEGFADMEGFALIIEAKVKIKLKSSEEVKGKITRIFHNCVDGEWRWRILLAGDDGSIENVISLNEIQELIHRAT